MKLGKIYDYRNKEEAKKLIGKKVLANDILFKLESQNELNICTLTGIEDSSDYPFVVDNMGLYQFIREIEEEDEPKRMTNRQLAKWASKRLGEIKNGKTVGVCVHYDEANENYPPDPTVRIRYWDSDEWIVPTVDIYNRDCKGE